MKTTPREASRMQFETRFDLGQEVVTIHNTQQPVFIPCDMCGATGYMPDPDPTKRAWHCPKCNGHKGATKYEPTAWAIDQYAAHVASIRVEVSDDGREGSSEGIRYMLRETGCPSGTLHLADTVFASVAEAQAECDRRNKGGE